MWELAQMHGIDLNCDYNKAEVKSLVINTFKTNWQYALNDIAKNPLLRIYSTFKYDFGFEPFLYMVKDPKYRIAIAKFRASSHTLEIERGRHTKPKTLVAERLCHLCRVVEDEIHFLISCPLYHDEKDGPCLTLWYRNAPSSALCLSENHSCSCSQVRMQIFLHGQVNYLQCLQKEKSCSVHMTHLISRINCD